MEKTVIKQGEVLVKRDGIIYELDKKTFNIVRPIIFETDSELCRHCQDTSCKCHKEIGDDNITDALTLKEKIVCDYVLGCKKFTPKNIVGERKVTYYNTDEETLREEERTMGEEEKTIRQYSDAYDRPVSHPTVAKLIRKMR